jgi:hypothetical protein
MKYTLFIVLSIITILFLFIVNYKFYTTTATTTTNTNSQLIKGPGTPINDEYYPIVVNEENGSQNLITNKSKLNYDVKNNILYAVNFQGSLQNTSALVSNLIKENANNNLLVQRSNNTTTLISPGKTSDVLFSNGSNNIPYWAGLYDNIVGIDSILYRPIVQNESSTNIYNITNDVVYNNETELTEDLYARNLTINNILYSRGARIFVTNKLIINEKIIHNRNYAPGTTLGQGRPTNTGTLSNNPQPTNSEAGVGGGRNGASGGGVVYPSNKEGGQKLFYQYPYFLLMGYYDTTNNLVYYRGGASGSAGLSSSGFRGGTGGAGGGVIHICAKNIEFGPNGKIEAVGENGGNGGIDSSGIVRGGGGCGGGGGLIVIVTNTKGLSPTDTTKFNVSGGEPGSTTNGNPRKGGDGKVIIFNL